MAFTITSPFGLRLFANLAPWQTDDLGRYCQGIGVMVDPLTDLISEVGSDGDVGFVPTWGKLFDVNQDPYVDLGYLGQYVGVSIPAGTSDYDARALVRQEAGMSRGSVASLASAVVRSISTQWFPNTGYIAGSIVNNAGSYYTANAVGNNGTWTGTAGTWAASTSTWTAAGIAFTTGTTFNPAQFTAIDITTHYVLRERITPRGVIDANWFTVVVRPGELTPNNNTAQLVANINAVKPAGLLLGLIVSAGNTWLGAVGAWNGTQAAGVTWAQADTTNP